MPTIYGKGVYIRNMSLIYILSPSLALSAYPHVESPHRCSWPLGRHQPAADSCTTAALPELASTCSAQKDFQPETRAGGLVIASVGIYTKNIIAMLA